MKLKTKIIVFSSLFMLIVVMLMNAAIYYLFYKINTNNELRELQSTTEHVIEALIQNPDVNQSAMMEAYLPANGMIRVIIESGVPIIEQTRSGEYRSLPWQYQNFETSKIVRTKSAPSIAVVEKPMIWQSGEHKGEIVTLQVSNQLLLLDETMQTLLYVLIILSFVVLIPVYILSSLLSRFLLRPIQMLIHAMKENMERGKWKKIDELNRSKDEIQIMQRTFNEMIDHLKIGYEKQEMFVSDASHELKTPIQIIKSNAQFLKRRLNVDSEVFMESLDVIDSETERMKSLVDQMLTLAKNQETKLNERVNLTEVVESSVAAFCSTNERNITLQIDYETMIVSGNRKQLEQVIYILIDNALKYSNDEIDVHVSREQNDGVVKITDYGQGISDKDQMRIFDRFYRVDKARSRNTGGTGLGLAIAKAITDLHGGELTVESKINVGTTFTLKLKMIE